MLNSKNQRTFGTKKSNIIKNDLSTIKPSWHSSNVDNENPYSEQNDKRPRNPLEDLDLSTFNDSRPKKRAITSPKSDLLSLISKGTVEDIDYLAKEIEKEQKMLHVRNGLVIKGPERLNENNKEFTEWIESLGFVEKYLGKKQFFEIHNYDKVNNIQSLIKEKASDRSHLQRSVDSTVRSTRASNQAGNTFGLKIDVGHGVANGKAAGSNLSTWFGYRQNDFNDDKDSPVTCHNSESSQNGPITAFSPRNHVDPRSSAPSPSIEVEKSFSKIQFFEDKVPYTTSNLSAKNVLRPIPKSSTAPATTLLDAINDRLEKVNEENSNNITDQNDSQELVFIRNSDELRTDHLTSIKEFGNTKDSITFDTTLSPIKAIPESNIIENRAPYNFSLNLGKLSHLTAREAQIFVPSKMSGGPNPMNPSAFAYKNNHNDSDSEPKTHLRRASTVPTTSQSNIHASPQGKCCFSQNDAITFCTPQAQTIEKAVSGIHYDWGADTNMASESVCERLLAKFSCHVTQAENIHSSLKSANVAEPRLRRSNTLGDLPKISRPKPLMPNSDFPNIGQFDNNDIFPVHKVVSSFNGISAFANSLGTQSIERESFSNRLGDDVNIRNLNRSRQKWRRRSCIRGKMNSANDISLDNSGSHLPSEQMLDDSMMNRSGSHHLSFETATSLSPAVSNKYRTSTNYKLRFSLNKHQNSAMKYSEDSNGSDSDDSFAITAQSFISPTHDSSGSANNNLLHFSLHNTDEHYNNVIGLCEFNFRVNLIGGTYQYSFQDNYPVVAPPATSDNRIVGVHFSRSDGSLTLRIYCPTSKVEKLVQLSPSWTWMIAKPVGCIVFKESIVPERNSVGYFVYQHPSDWDDHSPLRRDISQNLEDRLTTNIQSANASFVSSSSQSNYYYGSKTTQNVPVMLNDDENYNNMNISISSGVFHNATDPNDEFNASTDSVMWPMTQHSQISDAVTDIIHVDSDQSVIHQTSDEELDFVDWTSSSVISTVIEYLINYEIDFTISGKPRKIAELSNDSDSNDKSSYRNYGSWMFVCKTWALATCRHYASYRSKISEYHLMTHSEWVKYLTVFNWGKFLGEGACKRVYCVQDRNRCTKYAVSLIDVNDMDSRGMKEVIQQEQTISMICSSLTTLNICPNLVRVYALFHSSYYPPKELWESILPPFTAHNKRNIIFPDQKRSKRESDKKYQYVRMEFCTGGDLDDYVLKTKVIEIDVVRMLLFQMLFALYSCREQLALRHYDIKLLNFLVTSPQALTSKPLNKPSRVKFNSSQQQMVQLNIGFGQFIYRMNLSTDKNELVKLTDFGTSLIGAGGLGDPITAEQLTTLENTPIEFLLLGSDARQAYSADTFCLGLSMFHLVAGHQPYEELLKDVLCPDYLATLLETFWMTEDEDNAFYVIRLVIDSLEPDGNEKPGMALYHTIYRYFVLFGAMKDQMNVSNQVYSSSPVWQSLVDALNLPYQTGKKASKPKRGKKSAMREECQQKYVQDCNQWSVMNGQHRIMIDFRKRMQLLGDGTMKLLEKLIHFDPSRRCSLHEAILSPTFDCLRNDHQTSGHRNMAGDNADLDESTDYADVSMAMSEEESPNIVEKVSFMHYFRTDTSGVDGLPML